MPYRCRADQLFLPIDAELEPEISESDLLNLLPLGRIFVWHPAIGLLGFDPEHVLSVRELLRPPAVVNGDWDGAEIGEQLNDTIRNLLPEPAPDAGAILNRGQDDIGSEASNIDDAPKAPDEKSAAAVRDAVQGALDGLSRAVARAVHNMTSRMPTSDSGNRRLGRLHAWAESILNGLNSTGGNGPAGTLPPPDSRLSAKRENELKRLLNLLENNPDQGLKYALPIGGENHGRGMAPPSDRLFENSGDFDLSQLRRSGRTDMWDLPWEYQVRLMQMYRELAQREQQLGRYRRAAYIYASLLADLQSAAVALEAGQFYHDAAAVYLEHLHHPLKAAECLRRGGFWEEAVQIYRNRERWIDAAELYVEIGRPDDAREMFHNEISSCQERHDYAAAGELADRRLDDPELATTLLFTGWMQAADGRTCFRQLLELNGRRGNHSDALWAMQQLTADDDFGESQLEDAVRVCSEAATAYPDESVRTAARQHTLRLAATLLKNSDDAAFVGERQSTALAAVRSLAQADRLLHSDTQRYELQLNLTKQTPPKRVFRRSGALRAIREVGTTDLQPDGTPIGTRWWHVVSNGSFVFRCGETPDGRTVVARQLLVTRRDGRLVADDWLLTLPERTSLDPQGFQLRMVPEKSQALLLWLPGQFPWCASAKNLQAIRESGFLNTINIRLDSVCAVDVSPTGWIFCVNLAAGETEWYDEICVLNASMTVDQRIRIDSPWDQIDVESVRPFAGLHVDAHAYRVIRKTVLRTDSSFSELTEENLRSTTAHVVEQLHDSPTRMSVSPGTTVTRLVFSFEQGARAVWPVRGESCAVASDLVDPITAFTLNGILAAACQQTDRLEFYRLNDSQAELIGEVRAGGMIQHLTCGTVPNQILAFRSDGQVTQFEVPVR